MRFFYEFFSKAFLHLLTAFILIPMIGFGQMKIKAQKLPDNVSSPLYREYAPSLNADGTILIFQANRKDGDNWGIYETITKDNGLTWSDPVGIDSVNNYANQDDLIGGPVISYDGNTLYFFANLDEGLGAEDIYYSERIGDKWSSPKNIGSPINTKYHESFPSISADGTHLYFMRFDADSISDSNTCFEIYVSEKQSNGEWGIPEALPAPINLECEKAPRILSDGRTLIFSSIRAGGKGDYDLWMSKLGFNGEWSEPVNMHFVNTPGTDTFASISASGETLYYLNRGKPDPKVLKKYPGEMQQEDIYTIQITEEFKQYKNKTIQGQIIDSKDQSPVQATFYVRDRSTTERLFELPVAEDGKFALVLTEGIDYEILVTKEGYSTYIFQEDLSDLKHYEREKKNINLFSHALLNLEVFDADLMSKIESNIVVYNKETNLPFDDIEIIYNEKLTSYSLKLPIGNLYEVQVSKDNFQTQSFTFDLSTMLLYQKFEKSIDLMPNKVEMQFNVADAATEEGIMAKIVLINTDTDERIEVEAEMGEDGKYKIEVRDGASYEIEVRSPRGYSFFSSKLKASDKKEFDVALTELKPNSKLPLKDILFESNSSEIIESSFRELRRLVKLMKDNPNIVVELAAHTDDVGSDRYNMKLSEHRAKNVAMYVMDFGIPKNRLVPKGYGESQPTVLNDTEENKAMNRRVELMVLEINN
ncbi:OmpA family protein [Flammeovirga yaeyamensis]|uniref:OmpA family protein n=1 Tax=Flammeovirga yaeyamensis TaxID=367791 RepID=A0AAX1NBF6_9BACT|nr:OmpA family protein [Flammeovirga yaeyamensis]MBB3699286.1 outer membrane protein OmpA-like peptidoglycan-associated protein/Tol biopolymer transport system component [Flammeovirga yaeyamensis]NMF35451.1 OmpA family protein [Flammeovirga yaeyamensis]QWG04311.1 OmpA family protein [Flammeovirga yaeyamensis]